MLNRSRCQRPDRRGAILVLIAVLMPVFALMAAFAVDVAWMQLVRTELRTATDSASRAGAKTLSLQQNQGRARAEAIVAASRNQVAGGPLRLAPGDVQFGKSEQLNPNAPFVFNAGLQPINAVHVDGRRNAGSLGGPVPLFFGRVLGVNDFQPVQTATSTILDRDLCIVIDRSGSMGLPVTQAGGGNGQNCGPLDADTRFAALALAVSDFLSELDLTFPNEQVSLVSYSSRNTVNCRGGNLRFEVADTREPLTNRYDNIRDEMNNFMTRGIGGSTAIGEGLFEGLRAIKGPNARPFAIKTVVLMTDGRHNTGVEPIVPARQAARERITVHTVTFSRGAQQRPMRQVANETGGQHFHADTTNDLREIFREIARTLPVLLTE